jgi:Tn3 transposase DDE domain
LLGVAPTSSAARIAAQAAIPHGRVSTRCPRRCWNTESCYARSTPPKAHSHTLVVNLCVLSTTGYLNDAIDAQRADGHPVSSEAIANLSPGQFETINPYGTLTFDITAVLELPRRPPATTNPH